jgi:hypothetical protein
MSQGSSVSVAAMLEAGQLGFFWDFGLSWQCADNGGRKNLEHVSQFVWDYTAQRPRRQSSWSGIWLKAGAEILTGSEATQPPIQWVSGTISLGDNP